MRFVVMDLEWNNVYLKKTGGHINEIIEVGAVKLDENFEKTGSFSRPIRSQLGKRLRLSVKELTRLTNEDINSGEPFTKVFSAFRKWIGKEETVVFTWGDGDVRVLIDNFKYFNGVNKIPFLKNYCDLQRCFQQYSHGDKGRQASLLSAARSLGIEPDESVLHRALGDGALTAEILKKLYSSGSVEPNFIPCDDEFYAKLRFKPKIIRNINDPLADKKRLSHVCEVCGEPCVQMSEWDFRRQFFRADFYCKKCGGKYSVGVRFKKLYDGVESKKIVSVAKPELKNETEENSE